MRKISINDLSVIFSKIVLKLNQESHKEIEFSRDLYRIIPTEEWDSFGNVNIENCYLFDDIDHLKILAQGKNRLCTYVDFDRLASVLREISQINNPIS